MALLEVFTDGSTTANGKPECVAGWAFCTKVKDTVVIRYGNIPATATVGKAEIGGVLMALAILGEKNRLIIKSDSQYVVNQINKWRHSQGKTMSGVKNKEFLIPTYELFDKGKHNIQWVKGHSGVMGNELADVWAKKGKELDIINSSTKELNVKFVDYEKLEGLLDYGIPY